MRQSDESLVEETLLRPEAFAELVARYQDRICNLAYRITGDAEESKDLAQETFIKAYTALTSFRKDARFSPWLYRIAINLCLNYRKRRREKISIEEESVVDSTGLTPAEAAEQHETQQQVQQAILSLPESYRVVLVLRHINDLTYQEIAQALGIPVGTVKARLFRARQMLQERLRAEGMY